MGRMVDDLRDVSRITLNKHRSLVVDDNKDSANRLTEAVAPDLNRDVFLG
jgi:hypothetical protein